MKTLPLPARRLTAACLLLLAQLGAGAPTLAQGVSYRLNLDKSTVRLKATTNIAFLKEIKARVTRFEFQGQLDSANPASSRATVVIDMNSIKSETRLVSDSQIKEKVQAEQYPTATVTSKAVRAGARPDSYEIDVDVNLIGKTYSGSFTAEVVRFDKYIRLLGTYSRKTDSGNEAQLEFSLHLEKP